MKSYMIERYIVEDLTFEFSSENNNEILKFKSPRIFKKLRVMFLEMNLSVYLQNLQQHGMQVHFYLSKILMI